MSENRARGPLSGGIKMFTVRGIEIRLDYSWFIIFALITWTLAAGYFPQKYPNWPVVIYWTLGLITSLLFFVSVLLHELSHSFVAQARGIPVPRITLFIFGGASQLGQEPKSAGDEFIMAAAGPASSVAIGVICGLLWWIFRQANVVPMAALFGWLALINVMLAVFNLIPGFPLDGGRVLRAMVWAATGDLTRSTRIAAAAGKIIALIFIALGLYSFFTTGTFNGLWIAFIGWFLYSAAASSIQQQTLQDLLAGHTAGEVMWTDCPTVPPDTPVSDFVREHVLHTGRRCFPIDDGESIHGIATLHNLKAVPEDQWPHTPVRSIMVPLTELKSVSPRTPLTEVLEMISGDGVNQLPVMDDGRLVGMISRDSVMDFLRLKSELGLR